jgi:hypothetical protein
VRSRSLKGDESGARDGINRRRRAERSSRHGFINQAPADASEIISIEQIGVAVFSERNDKRLMA